MLASAQTHEYPPLKTLASARICEQSIYGLNIEIAEVSSCVVAIQPIRAHAEHILEAVDIIFREAFCVDLFSAPSAAPSTAL